MKNKSELHVLMYGAFVSGSRTINEWYQFLPKDIRKKAIKNAKKEGLLDVSAVSLSAAISSGFGWGLTKEGLAYWESINNLIQLINPRP